MPETDVRGSDAGTPLEPFDRALLLELLEQESRRLNLEIRHTDSRSFRDELKHRLDRVQTLTERIRET